MAAEMQSPESKGGASATLIPVAEIRDGIIILDDGSMRAVLMISSINFALKGEEEQNAIVYAYQDFLNALDYPVQMTVSSRKLDITPYLQEVRVRREKQHNELLRLQMGEYINFVEELVKDSNIMTKTFFVTVPFSITQSKKEGFFKRTFKGMRGMVGKRVMSEEEFEHNKAQLLQRVEQVAVGLRAMGLRFVPLNTQEVLELLYNTYNPRTAHTQRLRSVSQLKVQETETSGVSNS